MSITQDVVKARLWLSWGVTCLVGQGGQWFRKTVCVKAFMIRSLPGKLRFRKLWVAASGLNRKEAGWAEQVDKVENRVGADPPRAPFSRPPLLPSSFTHISL